MDGEKNIGKGEAVGRCPRVLFSHSDIERSTVMKAATMNFADAARIWLKLVMSMPMALDLPLLQYE